MVRKPPAIVSLEDFDESINMLVYGDSGVGKTVFGGSANSLIIGVEKGTISAKRQGSKADLWQVETWEDVQAAYQWLKDNPDHGYDWIVLDSLTEMQQKALRWILDEAVNDNPNRDPDIPQLQEHQKWQNMFKRFVKSFNDLPVNTLFTATTLRVENEEGDDIVLPDIQGKGYQIAQWTCAQMSCVGYLSVHKKKVKQDDDERKTVEVYRIRWRTSPPYFAKDRYDVLVPYTENKTLAEITDRINSTDPISGNATVSKPARVAKVDVAPEVGEEDDDDEVEGA